MCLVLLFSIIFEISGCISISLVEFILIAIKYSLMEIAYFLISLLSIWANYLFGPLWLLYGEGNGTPLQYSCLKNPMDGGAWEAAVHGVAKSQTRLSDFTFTFTFMHWRSQWQPTPVFLPRESQGWGSLVGCCLWGRTESDTTEAT